MQAATDQTHSPAARSGRPSPGARRFPGPAQLPGIEGFYVLRPDGVLGRFDSTGAWQPEPRLGKSLRKQIRVFLAQYRSGAGQGLEIGLVADLGSARPWQCASLVFADAVVREIFRTGTDPRAPLTAFQKRNKVKSVFQGMELVLDTQKASRPECPRFCPVLFAPEIGSEALGKRYGTDYVDARNSLELLDLLAPFTPDEQRHPSLTSMVIEMRQARIAPELRRGTELSLVEDIDAPAITGFDSSSDPWQDYAQPPWQDLPGQGQVSFDDGDPVPYWLLAWFAPFNALTEKQRRTLARDLRVVKRPAGTLLIKRGSQKDDTLFLIDGMLELEAYDGRHATISAATRRARLPISQLRPHAYTITALTQVSLIRISQRIILEAIRATADIKSSALR